jgi:hypothetical protein
MPRRRLYLMFGGLSAVCFIVYTLGFEIAARMAVAGESLSLAVSGSGHYMAAQPIGTLMLLAPFVAMAVLSAEVARASNRASAAVFFSALAAALGWLYFSGHWDAQLALAQRKWTAAALSVGLLPFLSVPVLFIAAIAAGLIAWRFRRRET